MVSEGQHVSWVLKGEQGFIKEGRGAGPEEMGQAETETEKAVSQQGSNQTLVTEEEDQE